MFSLHRNHWLKGIVNIIEPTHGTVLDPACGSGMFVSCDFVNAEGAMPTCNDFTVRKVEFNAALHRNMAVHGLNAKIKSGDEANSHHDALP